MNKFEAVILFSPDISNTLIDKEVAVFTKNIEGSEGQIVSSEDWGLRDLSFNINKYKKAFYKYYQLEINGNYIKDLKKNLTQNEKILRSLFVKVEKHQQLPTKMINNEEK